MLATLLAQLPEFAHLVQDVLKTLHGDDQATLKDAYALAIQESDQAHAELQALVAAKS